MAARCRPGFSTRQILTIPFLTFTNPKPNLPTHEAEDDGRMGHGVTEYTCTTIFRRVSGLGFLISTLNNAGGRPYPENLGGREIDPSGSWYSYPSVLRRESRTRPTPQTQQALSTLHSLRSRARVVASPRRAVRRVGPGLGRRCRALSSTLYILYTLRLRLSTLSSSMVSARTSPHSPAGSGVCVWGGGGGDLFVIDYGWSRQAGYALVHVLVRMRAAGQEGGRGGASSAPLFQKAGPASISQT